jgi:hypothetical protein
LYSPALNSNIWQIETDRTDLLYFLVTVTKSDGVSALSNLKIYPTPAYRNGSYIDLSEVLKNVVITTIKKNDNLVEVLDDVYQYRLNIQEYVYDESINNVSTGASLTTGFFNVFNGKLPKITMSDYNYQTLTLTSTSTPRFLTNKPISAIKYWSTEYLYYLNNNRVTGLVYTLNYSTGIVTKSFPIATGKKSGRINISPRALAVNGMTLINLQSYTVHLMAGSVVASEVLTRYYSGTDCSDSPVNIIWVNNFSGVDSYLFKNPREKINIDKVTIKTNTFGVNAAGFYVNSNDNIYQTNEQIIASDTTSNYTVVSDWLNNKEAAWIASVLSSKAVYVELTNGKLLPVTISTSSADISNSKYGNKMNSFELTFTSESGLINSLEETLSDNMLIGIVGTSNTNTVLQTTNYEYVVGLNGVVRI